MTIISSDPRELLRRCHAAAVVAVQPEEAMRRPLGAVAPGESPTWIVAIGKAAPGMTRALIRWLAEHGREPAGGIVVAAGPGESPHAALQIMTGEHPIPGVLSERAAAAIATLLDSMPLDAEVHVAISGGASALMAGPLPPLAMSDVTRTFEQLISSGLDIGEMNAVRKRITRWSAGRLALRLAPRRVRAWMISDVAGDDPASIGSGPCTGDRWTSDEVTAMLRRRRLFDALPDAVRAAMAVETPKPGDANLARVESRIVATNADAMAAAAVAAAMPGIAVEIMQPPMSGAAADMGRAIAVAMGERSATPTVAIWGGETIVRMTNGSGDGGRSQELALAAAEMLRGTGTVLLAAGTDGRDGPTDAAGALVDGSTWDRMVAAGRNPADDLRRHDSYPALNAAGALVVTGPSGTNVMDLVIAASGWR